MRKLSLCFALALALGWARCPEVSAQASFYEWVYWDARAQPAPFEAGSQTRAIGQLLFEQNFVSAAEVSLPAGASIPIPAATIFSRSPGNAVVEPGATLSRVTTADVPMYCDRRVTFRARDGRRQRLCLLDANGDRSFDVVYWGAGSPANSAFTPFTAFRPDRSNAAVNYVQSTEQTTPLLIAGVVVTRSALNAYRLRFAVAGPDGPSVLLDATARGWEHRVEGEGPFSGEVFFRSSDIPLRLRLAGAEVEITSIVGDAVTYRVISTFNTASVVAIAYKDDLPH